MDNGYFVAIIQISHLMGYLTAIIPRCILMVIVMTMLIISMGYLWMIEKITYLSTQINFMLGAWFNLSPSKISDCIHYKVWDEITDPLNKLQQYNHWSLRTGKNFLPLFKWACDY